MNRIQKMLLLLLTIICACLLTACDYEYYLYHEHIRQNTEVVKVDLIRYENPINTDNHSDDTTYDIEKLVVLESLSTDDNEIFLSELSVIGGLSSKLKQTISSPNGTGILISYQDGGFTLITVAEIDNSDCIFVGHYGADESLEGCYGISWTDMITDFKAILVEYFDAEIDW